MNPVMAKMKLANVPEGDFAGIRDWKARNINNYEEPPARELNPYRKLMMAVLMDAIDTLKREPHSEQNKRNYVWADTQRWLMSNKQTYCLQFVPICEYFGWSATSVRKKIIEYLKQAHEKREIKPRREQVRQTWKVQPEGKGRHP